MVDGLRCHRSVAGDVGIPEAGLPDQLAPIAHGEIEAGGSMGTHDMQHVVAGGVDEPALEGAIGVDVFRNGNFLLRCASRGSREENCECQETGGDR